MDLTNILTSTVDYIEEHINEKFTIEELAKELFFSPSHLQRLFKSASGHSLMDYARGRRLAHSLEILYSKELRIIDIAKNFGFEHEQSYIHAFRTEYGCTPGKARKNKIGLPIREKLSFVNVNGTAALYGPEIVMSPRLCVVGKPYYFENFVFERDALTPNRLALRFGIDFLPQIPNVLHPPVYIGFGINHAERRLEYMPGVSVKDLKHIPPGLTGREIPSCLCARFIYIGEHSFEDIDMVTAGEMYAAMHRFWDMQTRYIRDGNYFYERVEPKLIDGKYCRMERYLPVTDDLRRK